MRRATALFGVLTAFFAATIWMGVLANSEAPQRVTITIYFGPQAKPTIEKTVEIAAGASAMDAVRKAARVETNSDGTFLNSIEGMANSTERGEFWIYFINGESMHVSAAARKLESGDRIFWFLRRSGSASHSQG